MVPRSPDYWLDKAEEARATAEAMRSPAGRRAMLDIAEQYEALAERMRELEAKFGRGDACRNLLAEWHSCA